MTNSLQRTEQAQTLAEPRPPVETFVPRADILETADELLLLLDVPGVKVDGLELQFERGELVVHGKVAQPVERPRWLVSEYEVGDFYRAFLIGQEIDASRISAELKNGVLTLHLPKVEAVRPRRIPVQGN